MFTQHTRRYKGTVITIYRGLSKKGCTPIIRNLMMQMSGVVNEYIELE